MDWHETLPLRIEVRLEGELADLLGVETALRIVRRLQERRRHLKHVLRLKQPPLRFVVRAGLHRPCDPRSGPAARTALPSLASVAIPAACRRGSQRLPPPCTAGPPLSAAQGMAAWCPLG